MRIAVAAGTAIALGAAGLAGIAVATTPDAIPDSTTKVITSCVNKRTGKVRFIDAQAGERCRKSQRTVRFNKAGKRGATGKTGARGPKGTRGPTGKTGAVGPTGPSNGYVASITARNLYVGVPVTVVQKSLPAGKYIVSASGTLDNPDASVTFCTLTASDNPPLQSSTAASDSAGLSSIAVNGSVDSPGRILIRLVCNASAPAALRNATITAVKVGQLS